MEFRRLGNSGLKVPLLCFGTATFGGSDEAFRGFGSSDVAEATRMVDLCLDAGVNFFDTADIYSYGASEQILGQAIKGRRDKVLLSTKATFRFGNGPNDIGSSRYHLTKAIDASLKRLGTDHVDIYFMHGFDASTAVEETVRALDDMVRAGKVLYLGCSNFSGWHLMKSLSIADRYGLSRYVSHQAYYSLVGREYEWELMPLAIDQGLGTMVWSPLGWGRLTGKISRHNPPAANTRLQNKVTASIGPKVADEKLFNVVDALEAVAKEVGKSVPQVALNWLAQRPTVSTIVLGARTEEQLKQNLAAVGWNLTKEQVARLDQASSVDPIYPYWHQDQFKERTARPV